MLCSTASGLLLLHSQRICVSQKARTLLLSFPFFFCVSCREWHVHSAQVLRSFRTNLRGRWLRRFCFPRPPFFVAGVALCVASLRVARPCLLVASTHFPLCVSSYCSHDHTSLRFTPRATTVSGRFTQLFIANTLLVGLCIVLNSSKKKSYPPDFL